MLYNINFHGSKIGVIEAETLIQARAIARSQVWASPQITISAKITPLRQFFNTTTIKGQTVHYNIDQLDEVNQLRANAGMGLI